MSVKYRFGIATFAVLALALFFIALGASMIAMDWETRADWIETDAKIVSTRMERERSPRGTTFVIVQYARVSFSLPDGRPVNASVRTDAAKDATIRIRYDRKRPNTIKRADLAGDTAGGLFLLALGALCLVGAYFVARLPGRAGGARTA